MSTDDRATTYANAFYDSASENWLTTLRGVVARLEQDPGLRARVQASGVDFAQRQRLLDGLLTESADPLVRNLLYTLTQRHDLDLLPAIITALQDRICRSESGPLETEVVSAVPLSPEQRQAVVTALQQQHGANLDIHYRVDPSILGGLVVRVGDRLMDTSLATRLAAMKQALGVRATE